MKLYILTDLILITEIVNGTEKCTGYLELDHLSGCKNIINSKYLRNAFQIYGKNG